VLVIHIRRTSERSRLRISMVRYIALLAASVATFTGTVQAQADGNPHDWDRHRRCDHIDYSPKCGACEGIGGIVKSDKKDDITIPSCSEVNVPGGSDNKSLKRPIWGADFTETMSHEILIGKKIDPACFQAFPGNESNGDNCYKPQDCKIVTDFKKKNAMKLDCLQSGNAWNLLGKVRSVILHQGQHMWITNHLPLKITQTICTGPREGGDKAKPPIFPVQYNWVDNLIFVARETINVEYKVGSKTLDHWAFGPHHAWTDPSTGLIVRMWQPYNGLQIFEPGTFSVGHDDAEFDLLSEDGKTSPPLARKGGSPFRIKCTDEGFPLDDPKASVPQIEISADLKRAKTKKPRDAFRGDGFEKMSHVLNNHLRSNSPVPRNATCGLLRNSSNFRSS